MAKAHVIIDFYQADEQTLARAELLESALVKALQDIDIEVNQEHTKFFQFEPFGVTATVVADEMHLNIHTWPEHQSCAIDMYSAIDQKVLVKVAEAVQKRLQAAEHQMKVLKRA